MIEKVCRDGRRPRVTMANNYEIKYGASLLAESKDTIHKGETGRLAGTDNQYEYIL